MSSDEKKLDPQSLQHYLQDSDSLPPKHFFEQFSDLTIPDLKAFKNVWTDAALQRKLEFFEGLEETAAGDALVSYEALGMELIHDPYPAIRKAAIELLWESENYHLADELLPIAKEDPGVSVQVAAVKALGIFIYLGEVDKISYTRKNNIEKYLLEVMRSDEIDYKKQKALESLGYSCLDDISALIHQAIDRDDQDWLLSALIAIGRTADEKWEPFILETLDHPDTDIQIEAIRAAGDLEISAAVEFLVALIEESDEIPDDLFTTTVWALSQIGGSKAIELINTLIDNAENDEDVEFLENAMDNLELKQTIDDLDFFSFDSSNDNFHTEILDDPNEDNH